MSWISWRKQVIHFINYPSEPFLPYVIKSYLGADDKIHVSLKLSPDEEAEFTGMLQVFIDGGKESELIVLWKDYRMWQARKWIKLKDQ